MEQRHRIWQLRHLLGPHIVVYLDGAKVGAGSFRQSAASVDLYNVIVMVS